MHADGVALPSRYIPEESSEMTSPEVLQRKEEAVSAPTSARKWAPVVEYVECMDMLEFTTTRSSIPSEVTENSTLPAIPEESTVPTTETFQSGTNTMPKIICPNCGHDYPATPSSNESPGPVHIEPTEAQEAKTKREKEEEEERIWQENYERWSKEEMKEFPASPDISDEDKRKMRESLLEPWEFMHERTLIPKVLYEHYPQGPVILVKRSKEGVQGAEAGGAMEGVGKASTKPGPIFLVQRTKSHRLKFWKM
ncbi:hypothetical protein RUND412_003757 [Rhizina undulata]